MSEYIAKASIEPRDYRVVFLIQKDGPPELGKPSTFLNLIQITYYTNSMNTSIAASPLRCPIFTILV